MNYLYLGRLAVIGLAGIIRVLNLLARSVVLHMRSRFQEPWLWLAVQLSQRRGIAPVVCLLNERLVLLLKLRLQGLFVNGETPHFD